MSEEKTRTGISISKKLLAECDKYLQDSGYTNHSELIEAALKFFLAARNISEKSEVLVPELAECIAAENDRVISKLSKGMFRYAVELEVLIEILEGTFELDKNQLKEIRRNAVNNVRRTRGKIDLDDLIARADKEVNSL